MDSMRDRFVSTTSRLLDTHERLAVLLADIGVDRFRREGVLERHPARVLNVGIREQALVGVAAGLALEGFRPVVHSYAPFLVERPFEQLKLDLSHQGVAAVLVSCGASFDAASSGRTHQALGDVALVDTLPEWQVHVPGHADEAERLLRHAVDGSGNVYLRLSEMANAEPVPIEPGHLFPIREGGAQAPTVIAVGPMLDPVREGLADRDVNLLYATTVRPLDAAALRRAVTGTDVVLVEPYLRGTSTAAVSDALRDRPHRILAVGVAPQEHRRYGSPAEHAAGHGLDARGVRRQVMDFVAAA